MGRMRLLITGGAGCLGSNLVEHYLAHGHELAVIDNFATSNRATLPASPRLEVVEGSIADAVLVEDIFERFAPTHVIHSAASYKDPDDWAQDTSTNVQGTINIVRSAERNGVARIVNFQTALCYGEPERIPIPVEHPCRPITSYGISKTAGEQYLLQATVPVTSLRLANVCAPRLAIGPIPTFYQRLKADKACFCSDTIRDFLDIADLIDLVDLALADGAPSGVFNVSSGHGHSIKEVFDVVAAHLGIRDVDDVPIVPKGDDDIAVVVLDPSRTAAEFGWHARIGFVATIERMLAWYDAHGVNDVYSHLRTPEANDAS